ncbi:hypothetical protein [Sulfitobacter sp. MF3-043]|uniref:hypothetical protein n=1 Tax=Sulfitobacter sediminivivens TaxID=3252902 RepID=UPI0036DC719E
MTAVQLTKTKMQQGVWQGIITQNGTDTPQIDVSHQKNSIADVSITHDSAANHWVLSVPIPKEAIADGVQTLIIRDTAADENIGHITLLAGEVLGDDIRAEIDLLRAELDMLKRAFRRHCLETM